MNDQFLTTKEAQNRLKIGRNALFHLIHKDPTFPVIRLGEKKLIILGDQLPIWAKNKLELEQQAKN